MNGLLDLFKSEKAVACLGAMGLATMFVFLNRMTIADWQNFTTWVLGFYVAGKTVQGGIETMSSAKASKTVEAPKEEGPPDA